MEQVTNAMLPSWIQWILLLFAAVGVIGAGFSYIGKLVQKATKPINDLTKNLDALAHRGEERDQRVDMLEGAIMQIKEYNEKTCSLLLTISDSLTNGIDVGAVKKNKEDMNKFLASKLKT